MSAPDNSPDYAVREIEVTTPKLRSDLRWNFQEVRGADTYLLEDPLQGRFFRLGRKEYEFACQLDGTRTVASLVGSMAKRDGASALDPEEAVALVRQLVDAGLVASLDGKHADRIWKEVNRPQESKRLLGKPGQLLFLKIPLGNPDRFFAFAADRAGWLAGPWFALLWLAVLVWGATAVYGEKERFAAQMSGLFDFGNLWVLGGLWLVLKVFHECWHGFVCRRFGGAVPEAGVTLLLFTTPLGYVNASSSTAFPSRWHRIAVSAAGMYGELFVAALAAIFWARTEAGVLNEALHQVVVLSSVTTVLFNANPLMRFDGYYILSDLLDIPNLSTKGQSVFGWMMRRWIVGMKKAKFPLAKREPFLLIAVYGVAASLWKVIVFAGILIATALLFEGTGLLLAALVLLAMMIQWAAAVVKYLRKSAASEGLRPARLVLRVVGLVALVGAVLHWVEFAPRAKAPAVVRDVGGGEVRVECPGFLVEVKVKDGDTVSEGQILATLENVEEEGRLLELETEIEGARLRRDQFVESGRIAAAQAEEENLESLQAIARDLRTYVSSLELRAPRSGTVDGEQLDLLLDTWMEPGRRLFSVYAGTQRELLILAKPEDRASFEDAGEEGRVVEFFPRGRLRTWTARPGEIVPRATLVAGHFALIAPAGGPLPVRQRSGDRSPGPGEAEERAATDYELTAPRFEIHAELADAGVLLDGETGTARVQASRKQRLGDWMWTGLRRQVDFLLDRAGES